MPESIHSLVEREREAAFPDPAQVLEYRRLLDVRPPFSVDDNRHLRAMTQKPGTDVLCRPSFLVEASHLSNVCIGESGTADAFAARRPTLCRHVGHVVLVRAQKQAPVAVRFGVNAPPVVASVQNVQPVGNRPVDQHPRDPMGEHRPSAHLRRPVPVGANSGADPLPAPLALDDTLPESRLMFGATSCRLARTGAVRTSPRRLSRELDAAEGARANNWDRLWGHAADLLYRSMAAVPGALTRRPALVCLPLYQMGAHHA